MIREAIVAGKFYPANKNTLEKQISSFIKETKKENALACVMPHAGYVYSGEVAVNTANSIDIKENILLLGPNHTGLGTLFSIMSRGFWQTPLGEVEINSAIAESLKKECPLIKEDIQAQAYEHSLEVELPILQFLSKDKFSIVPLVLMPAQKPEYEKIAQAIFNTITNLGIKDKTLIVASSDMTHYESQESAKQKDNLAIEAILNLDADSLIERVEKHNITMCGYVPAAITIMAAKKLGAKKARLVKYQTSGDVSGDYDAVVGYAGITIS
ncbi:MAG: AmmeMemoRadiSam system protein B [Candidatus Omnitrophica bacterium]|nr:AmmeMemoRadiSam system protein B [Candidatus Omnitrophota bacterium]MDD5352307.1 AmmeMemoRadiSam system protein B [Candidatus Omnitrophota bacterium]MDD5549905.1 AmmeMemoRadiSam system protein B [Candidatus Omnitrophota bacterium]